jgi:hypothetical protein
LSVHSIERVVEKLSDPIEIRAAPENLEMELALAMSAIAKLRAETVRLWPIESGAER